METSVRLAGNQGGGLPEGSSTEQMEDELKVEADLTSGSNSGGRTELKSPDAQEAELPSEEESMVQEAGMPLDPPLQSPVVRVEEWQSSLEHVTMAVVGCQVRGAETLHPDQLRMQILIDSLPKTSVFGVAGGPVTVAEEPHQISGNVRAEAMWALNGRRDPQQTIIGRRPMLIMVDYFFLTCTYLTGEEGYGGRWLSHIIPRFFTVGSGLIVILPNDKWGQVQRMLQGTTEFVEGTDYERITLQEAGKYHPLWCATELVKQTDWEKLPAHFQQKTNLVAAAEVLDEKNPFVVIWNRSAITSADHAKALLGRIVEEVVAQQTEAAVADHCSVERLAEAEAGVAAQAAPHV